MQVSKEFLLEAVGLSLLVGLLLLGVKLFDRAYSLMTWFETEQEKQLEKMQEYEITQYENRTVDGITAVNYIKNMVYHYELNVLLKTGEQSFVVDSKEMCSELKEEGSEYYLNPFGLYECMVVRDENENIDYIWMKNREGESNE